VGIIRKERVLLFAKRESTYNDDFSGEGRGKCPKVYKWEGEKSGGTCPGGEISRGICPVAEMSVSQLQTTARTPF